MLQIHVFFHINGGFQTSQKDTFITFGKEMEPFIISKSGNTQWFVDIVWKTLAEAETTAAIISHEYDIHELCWNMTYMIFEYVWLWHTWFWYTCLIIVGSRIITHNLFWDIEYVIQVCQPIFEVGPKIPWTQNILNKNIYDLKYPGPKKY